MTNSPLDKEGPGPRGEPAGSELGLQLMDLNAAEAAEWLGSEPEETIAAALQAVFPGVARGILACLPGDLRERVLAAASAESRRQWATDTTYADGTIGQFMEAPIGVFGVHETVTEATVKLRELVKRVFITYGFVTDADGRLLGVITMRDLLFCEPGAKLGDVMLKSPFSLRPEMDLLTAMKAVLNRHYPVYPVCDEGGRLVGLVRGAEMFEQQAIELSAQAGSMVGVEKEERLSTPLMRSLKFRHPWLQLNLLTAFAAAAVVGVFQGTIDRIVVLAVFLPVLAGQSGNTGCQALAVALRGMTLGELKPGKERALLLKEGLLGLLNGALVGMTAGIGMFVVATMQGNPSAAVLGLVVFLAMIGSCLISGLSGVVVPLTLRKLGADPATASSIFLTTATDVASMGLFLGLATLLVR